MAASTLTPSEFEARRLLATRAQLDQRWCKIGDILNSGMDRRASDIHVDADYQAGGVWTGLRGAGVERIDRNRGTASVARLLPLPDDLSAWLGYQEIWDLDGGRTFAFRQAGLTVHVGEVGDPLKPQLFRLEWPGLSDWDRSGVGFQSPGAGHPHWQIDVFESLHEKRDSIRFDPDFRGEVENFDVEVVTPTLSDRIRALTFEKMHLASVAPWWLSRPAEFGLHHLNAPPGKEELLRWLTAALAYIKQELSRCTMRR
jgi:hypothetical protein